MGSHVSGYGKLSPVPEWTPAHLMEAFALASFHYDGDYKLDTDCSFLSPSGDGPSPGFVGEFLRITPFNSPVTLRNPRIRNLPCHQRIGWAVSQVPSRRGCTEGPSRQNQASPETGALGQS
jgi:hypothetical protein